MATFNQWATDYIHRLVTHQVSPPETVTLVLTVFLWPAFIIGLIILLIKTFKHFGYLAPALLSKVIAKKYPQHEEKIFLELSFPADTGKSSYATEQLYTLIHSLARQKTFVQKLKRYKKHYSLEIASTKSEGIRYVLVCPKADEEIIKRSLLSYLPGIKIKEIDDYIDAFTGTDSGLNIAELKLSSHFALSLQDQKTLSKHDPISYITGVMTKLDPSELVSFQVVTTPVLSQIHTKQTQEMSALRHKMYKQEPLNEFLQKTAIPLITLPLLIFKAAAKVIELTLMVGLSFVTAAVDSSGKSVPLLQKTEVKVNVQEVLNPYEQELRSVVKDKIDQHLFETSIRFLVVTKDEEEIQKRISGFLASFGPFTSPYQSLIAKGSIFKARSIKKRLLDFQERVVSKGLASNNPLLSSSEISDIYHFPYANTTKTEDIVKILSPELPAPLSLKTGRKLDVIFAKNNYGNSTTDIGLTDDERARHVYLLGRTGSGKSTIIYHMAKEDINRGRGVAVIDPHGDLAEALLATVPKERINDLIHFNPFDLKYPIRINLLELPEGLEDDELELEKELVAESVISVFRRIFSKEEYVNAHRIEYILRNTIYTSFTVPNRTLFTIYKLLTNKDFRTKTVNILDDENLKDFWKNEFGKAGSWQVVKMISGVTAKVGRFLYSPTAKRIIEKPKSTISFDELIGQGKILICNLSEGKIGEDTAQVLGLTIIARIHQAALRRARIDSIERKPFYLFVDEFQNFATTSFTRILSGGRKFGLRMTLAEQSSAQQQDRQVINVILANTGTVICFATASPLDEQMMESQFAPHVTRHDFTNLPKYRFYIKMSATEPEEPFSGETIPIDSKPDPKKISKLIEASRKNYASVYVKPKKEIKQEIVQKVDKNTLKGSGNRAGLPKSIRR